MSNALTLTVVKGDAGYSAQEGIDSTSPLLVVLAGSAVAVLMAWMVCGGPFLRPGAAGWREAVSYVVLTAVVGELGLRLGWAVLEVKPAVERGRLSWNAALGWVFLPCAVLLARGHSPWAMLVAMMAAVPAAVYLRQEFPALRETEARDETLLPSLNGMPPMRSGRFDALLGAVCMQERGGASNCESDGGGEPADGDGLGVSDVAGRSAPVTTIAGPSNRVLRIRLLCVTVVAVLATAMTQIVWPSFSSGLGAPKAEDRVTRGNDYFSVILLPPLKKKEVAPPRPVPPTQVPGNGSMTKPVVIPFNGPYWYFQPPTQRPGIEAHVAHGKPTEENIHSTDGEMLLMEAHQTLITPIELSCCREIDVALTNADTRPGTILVSVILRDSLTSGSLPLILRDQPIVSSEETHIAASRGPVNELLRFPINRVDPLLFPNRLQQFDEITVIFLPQGRRATGAKVAVKQFTLVP